MEQNRWNRYEKEMVYIFRNGIEKSNDWHLNRWGIKKTIEMKL